MVSPVAFRELRIDGETQVHPSDNDKTAMIRASTSTTPSPEDCRLAVSP